MRPDRVAAGAVGLLAALAHGTVTLLHLHQMRVTSWDNAIFEQVIASYARLEAPVSEVKGPGYNILGDHWSPIDALVAPFYAVLPSAQTVLLAQVVLLAISAVVVTLLATRVLGTVRGAVLGVLYALSFGLQNGVEADFHEVAFAVPLLALAGAAYVDRRYTAMLGWAAPLLLVKEDMGATVAMIGVVLWLAGDRRRGVWVAVGGLVAVAVTTLVLIPLFGDGYAYTSQVGADRSVLTTLLDSPGQKLGTVALTLAIVGFAALLSPWVLLVLPTFAWRFVGDNEFYWGLDWHYGMVLMPIVFVAFVDAWKRWQERGRPARVADAALGVASVASLVVAPMVTSLPVFELARSSTWADPPRAEAGREAVASVPRGVSVETDISLLKHLVTDRTAYWIGSIGDEVAPDYVAFDVDAGLGSPGDPLTYAEQRYGGSWFTVFDRDGFVVVRGASST